MSLKVLEITYPPGCSSQYFIADGPKVDDACNIILTNQTFFSYYPHSGKGQIQLETSSGEQVSSPYVVCHAAGMPREKCQKDLWGPTSKG